MVRDERLGTPPPRIDTHLMTTSLQTKLVDRKSQRFRLSRLSDSEQAIDITSGINCNGYGRLHTFRRTSSDGIWPENPLPIDPALHYFGSPNQKELVAQVLQLAGCNWRCWYCFVPYQLLLARDQDSSWFSSDEVLDLVDQDQSEHLVIDLSGGQPDLVPEWGLWMARAVSHRTAQNTYIWIDDNLSSDLIWSVLSPEDIEEFIAYRNVGRVGCFKGFDPESFVFNTNARSEEFDNQFDRFGAFHLAGFDMYAYITFTCTTTQDIQRKMSAFVERLQGISELLPLRTVPLEILSFAPTRARMTDVHYESMGNQEAAIEAWLEELEKRFSAELRATRITQIEL